MKLAARMYNKLDCLGELSMRLAFLEYGQLIRRGVSEPVARFITAERHPISVFDIFVRPIDSCWDYYVPPEVEDVLGLWDQNADAYARWSRGGVQEFVILHHDAPYPTLVAWTEQGLLADLVRHYHEMLDWHDEAGCLRQVQVFADYVGFRYTDTLIKYLATESETSDFLDEFRSRFGSLQ
jgi:hypothetical protein